MLTNRIPNVSHRSRIGVARRDRFRTPEPSPPKAKRVIRNWQWCSGMPIPFLAGLKGIKSNADRRTPISSPGASVRIPSTISRRKRVRFSKLPPYLPAFYSAEKFMTEIAVTVFDIHKMEARFLGEFRGAECNLQ